MRACDSCFSFLDKGWKRSAYTATGRKSGSLSWRSAKQQSWRQDEVAPVRCSPTKLKKTRSVLSVHLTPTLCLWDAQIRPHARTLTLLALILTLHYLHNNIYNHPHDNLCGVPRWSSGVAGVSAKRKQCMLGLWPAERVAFWEAVSCRQGL